AAAGGQRLFGQSGITPGLRPGVSRPLVNSRPRADRATGQPAAGQYVTSRPLGESGELGRTTGPLDPQQMFRETAFMIWGPDEDTHEQPIARSINGSASGRRRGDPAARPGDTVPPALQQGSMGLDESETRQAMNWVHWLQAQGAVVREDAAVEGAPP